MNEVVEFVVGIVALVLVGAFATFFMFLNLKKGEIWEEIHKRYIEDERNNKIDGQ